MKNFLTTLLATFGILGFISGQNTFDIRFALSNVDCDLNTACYDVQVRSSNSTPWGLAGQNYRIYYDNSKADYISGTKVLDSNYGTFTVVQDIGPVDATANSTALGFEATLGFFNYGIDLNNLSSGGVNIDGSWTTTSNICFSIDEAVINDPTECINLVWARDGLTNDLATAFVEISEWVSPNNTTDATGVIYDDLDSTDGDGACFSTSCADAPCEAEAPVISGN